MADNSEGLDSKSSADNFQTSILRAQGGVPDAAGDLLEPYRNYLRVLATAQLKEPLNQRLSPSDIVQDAMLAAYQNLKQFRGSSAAEFSAWLRTILTRCLYLAVNRNTKVAKRDYRREVSMNQIQKSVDSSNDRAISLFSANNPTPSQIVSRDEEIVRVANLLACLSEDYQQVIALRNFGNLRFEEVATRMDRSEQAVRLLWLRAVRQLRELYQSKEAK